jgi:hypothetical protein
VIAQLTGNTFQGRKEVGGLPGRNWLRRREREVYACDPAEEAILRAREQLAFLAKKAKEAYGVPELAPTPLEQELVRAAGRPILEALSEASDDSPLFRAFKALKQGVPIPIDL